MTGATAALSGWAVGLRFDDLPDDVVDRMLRHTLDAIGAIAVGAERSWTAGVRAYAADESPDGRSSVPRLARRLRPEWAALANGTAAHGFEIDDYALPGLSHPGSVVVPVALALGEHVDSDGRELIAALAAGFETTVRFGEACTPSLTSDRGFHVTSALGVFGAVAAAVRLMGLDARQAAAAYGIAASHAGGTAEFTRTGGDVKRLHAGMAAAGGIRSAAIAARGVTAPTAAIEGARGFLHTFVERARPEALTHGLGREWALRGLAMKRWCVCAGLQAPLAALDAALAAGVPDASRIDDLIEITVRCDRATLAHVGHIGGRPRDLTEAQMSVHHAIAMRLAAGGNDPAHYRRFEDGLAVAHLADLVRLEVDEEAERVFPRRLLAEVSLVTAHGTVTRRAEAPGSPGNPMSREQTTEKFRALCDPIIGERAARAVIDAVEAMRSGGGARAVFAAMQEDA
ncbi:MmgE/PrpD family protein [Agromyces sp. NPDC049794]|uniref:MmgE/PrpD family protein n=1 Tax=unclassified Agromyces TaxID=2639701 RepID=UPI0034106ED8